MTTTPDRVAGALVSRRRRSARDRDVAAALDWVTAPPIGLPAGLELQWLGTAGFRFSFGGVTLLVDPYVSRPDLRVVLSRRALVSSPDLVERHLPKADAVLVGHTHFDHALDVPALAARDGAEVYGSGSVVNLLGLYGLADQAVSVVPHKPYEIGPFTVTFVPSRHSKLLGGLAVPSAGELTCDHLDGLCSTAYRCGQVWGIHIEVDGFSLYHQGSADVVDDEVRHRGVDVFLCGIAGRLFTPHYLERILGLLSPKVVVPQHWDDFFRPLAAETASSFNVNLYRFPDEVADVSREFEVRTLEPMQTVTG